MKQLKRADRVDIVWGQYLENNMKSKTRKRCGSDAGLKDRSTNLPGNWQHFLSLDVNKKELFTFLVRHTMRMQYLPDGKQLVTTLGYDVLCNPPNDSIEQH